MHEIHFGARPLTIEEVVALAERRATPRLNPAPEFRAPTILTGCSPRKG